MKKLSASGNCSLIRNRLRTKEGERKKYGSGITPSKVEKENISKEICLVTSSAESILLKVSDKIFTDKIRS